MELQQALILAKAFFPEAYIDKPGNATYLMKDPDTILVVIEEPDSPVAYNGHDISESCWCPSMREHQFLSYWHPVKDITERQFAKELRKWKETPYW